MAGLRGQSRWGGEGNWPGWKHVTLAMYRGAAAYCRWALGPQPSPRARGSRWRGTLEGIQALSGVACPQCGATMPFELPIRLDGIPWDVALCLYRVAQEILRNIATHAAAHKAQVTSRSTEEGLELVIADDGKGFSLTEARGLGWLGLISLYRQVRLVGGVWQSTLNRSIAQRCE